MATDTGPGSLGDPKRHARPEFVNSLNFGQVAQIVTVVLSVGGVVLYQRSETEAIRSAAAVRDERLIAVQKEVQSNKESVSLQAAAQKEVLTEIKGDVKNIGANVQALTLQVQQLSMQQQARRP